MRDTAFAFFLAAVLCVTAGMGMGIYMGIAHDFLLAPVHAHLNLVGWATLALFGVYYRLTPQANGALARVHAVLAIAGVVALTGGMAWVFLADGPVAVAIAGSLLTAASMLVFLWTVVRHGFGAAEGRDWAASFGRPARA